MNHRQQPPQCREHRNAPWRSPQRPHRAAATAQQCFGGQSSRPRAAASSHSALVAETVTSAASRQQRCTHGPRAEAPSHPGPDASRLPTIGRYLPRPWPPSKRHGQPGAAQRPSRPRTQRSAALSSHAATPSHSPRHSAPCRASPLSSHAADLPGRRLRAPDPARTESAQSTGAPLATSRDTSAKSPTFAASNIARPPPTREAIAPIREPCRAGADLGLDSRPCITQAALPALRVSSQDAPRRELRNLARLLRDAQVGKLSPPLCLRGTSANAADELQHSRRAAPLCEAFASPAIGAPEQPPCSGAGAAPRHGGELVNDVHRAGWEGGRTLPKLGRHGTRHQGSIFDAKNTSRFPTRNRAPAAWRLPSPRYLLCLNARSHVRRVRLSLRVGQASSAGLRATHAAIVGPSGLNACFC